jgi:hypothetical protein
MSSKTNVSISRAFHDYLLDRDPKALKILFKLHKTKWHTGGVTFEDMGRWYLNYLDSELRDFLKQQECRRHFVVHQVK